MATKALQKESDVYLIDHAWSFRYQDAAATLMQQEGLLTRLEKMTEYSEKLDIPQQEEETKKQGPDAKAAFEAQLKAGGRVFELDGMGIESLAEFSWPETLEELSLIDNEIINPNDIAKYIVPLPKIKAMWFNANPVCDQCSNFSSIAELMPTLEIINSKFTNEAGEWAILFYAKDSGAKTLEEIEHLSLAGRGITYIKDISLFDRLTNLKRLDLTGHPEFFMCIEKKEALEFQSLIGIQKEQKQGVTFVGQNHNITEVLPKLKHLQELVCDEDLEEYIVENRDKNGMLPDLTVVNGVSTTVTDMTIRKKQKRVNSLVTKLSQYANQYLMGQGSLAVPVWYV